MHMEGGGISPQPKYAYSRKLEMTTMLSDPWLWWRYSKPRMAASKTAALTRLATPQSIGGPGGI